MVLVFEWWMPWKILATQVLLPAHVFRMVKHDQHFGERQIVTTLSAQLSWSHFVELIKVEDGVKRGFYTDMCAQSR